MKRFLSILALVAIVLGSTHIGVRADDTLLVVQAQGNANFVDFMARSGKRADLRLETAQKGVDVAFTDWLHSERPGAYAQAVKSGVSQDTAVAVAASCSTKSCCASKTSCCSAMASCATASASCCADGKTCTKGHSKGSCCDHSACNMKCCA
jgi:hypothetical protein